MTERTNDGRFAAGRSGNPAGRPRRERHRLHTPSDFRRAIIAIANRPTDITIRSKKEEVTVFEAHVFRCASDAKGGDNGFVALVMDAATLLHQVPDAIEKERRGTETAGDEQ